MIEEWDEREIQATTYAVQAQAQAEVAETDRINAVAFVLSDPKGRQFVWDWLSECGVFSASFHPEALKMAHNEGKREVGILLLRQIQDVNPRAYATMQTEHEDRQARYHAIPAPQRET